jgi:hypothetical protein
MESMDRWQPHATRWSAHRPPFRPSAADVAFASSIVRTDDRVVLLGVTPEYAELGQSLVAVDSSPAMISAIWPGDTTHHRVVLADWREFDMSCGDIIIGDGVLMSTESPEVVIAAMDRALRCGTREAALRVFVRPERQIQFSEIGDVSTGEGRLRYLMMVAGFMDGRVRIADSERLYHALFQTALNTSGSGSEVVLNFPTWKEIQHMLPDAQLLPDPACDLTGWVRWHG